MPSLFKIQKLSIWSFLIFLAAFAWSNILLYYYVGGDQIPYRHLYDALSNASLLEARSLGVTYVSSGDIVSISILWFGAYLGVEKNIYISLLNALLMLGIFLFFRKHKAPPYAHFLMITGFYTLVLMTGAERLKIAYLFIIYASFLPGWGMNFGWVLALLSHLQTLILFSTVLSKSLFTLISKLMLEFRLKMSFVFFISAVIGLMSLALFLFGDHISRKLSYYSYWSGELWELPKALVLFVIGLIVCSNRLQFIFGFLPLLVFVVLLGGARVNMICYTFLIYCLTTQGKLHHPLSVLIMFYFSLKSIPFLWKIFTTGDGFSSFPL